MPVDPLGRLPTIGSGTPACGKCAVFVPGEIVTVSLTDAAGHFTLPDTPSGAQIPLVFQVGKWRREIFLPEVPSCVETVVPAASSRLPRNQDEGDIPQFALLAGGCDRLACFMRDVGLDASEFTGPADHGRVHVYQGAGPGPLLSGGTSGDCTGRDAGACPLWSTKERLEKYDTLLLGCECGENTQTKTDMLPLHEWLDTGGNVFAIHSQRTWFKNSPDRSREVANWTDGASSRPFNADLSFTDGQIFHDWLAATNVLGPDGALLLNPAQVSTSVASVNSSATPWIAGDVRSIDPTAPRLLAASARSPSSRRWAGDLRRWELRCGRSAAGRCSRTSTRAEPTSSTRTPCPRVARAARCRRKRRRSSSSCSI